MRRFVSCAWVSVLVNSFIGGKLRMEKGLRQGCPLSSLLFNMVVEAFPILVHQFNDRGWLRGMSIQGVMERTSVLQYADDTILFLWRLVDLEVRLQRCLCIFSIISGPQINLHKSYLVGVGIDQGEVHRLASGLGC